MSSIKTTVIHVVLQKTKSVFNDVIFSRNTVNKHGFEKTKKRGEHCVNVAQNQRKIFWSQTSFYRQAWNHRLKWKYKMSSYSPIITTTTWNGTIFYCRLKREGLKRNSTKQLDILRNNTMSQLLIKINACKLFREQRNQFK